MKKTGILYAVLGAVMLLTSASVWEGAAVAAGPGELPDEGLYVATNSFPANTIVDLTNLETGTTLRVIVAKGLESPGLLAVISAEAAEAIGLKSRSLGRIRMSMPADPIAFSRFTEGDASSGDPDHDPKAAVAGAIPPVAVPPATPPAAAVNEPPAAATAPSATADAPASSGLAVELAVVAATETGAESAVVPEPESNAAEIVDVPESYVPPAIPETADASVQAEPVPTATVPVEPALAEADQVRVEPEPVMAPDPVETGPQTVGVVSLADEPEMDLVEVPAVAAPVSETPVAVVAVLESTPQVVDTVTAEVEQDPAAVDPEPAAPPVEEVAALTLEESTVEEPAPAVADIAPAPELVSAADPVVLDSDPTLETEVSLVPAEERPPEITAPVAVIPPEATVVVTESAPEPPAEPTPVAVAAVEEAAVTEDTQTVLSLPVVANLEKGKYYLQLGAYSKAAAVEALVKELGTIYPLTIQGAGTAAQPLYRILVGPVNLGESGALLQRFRLSGYRDVFIKQEG